MCLGCVGCVCVWCVCVSRVCVCVWGVCVCLWGVCVSLGCVFVSGVWSGWGSEETRQPGVDSLETERLVPGGLLYYSLHLSMFENFHNVR